jgi:hypothetical protein
MLLTIAGLPVTLTVSRWNMKCRGHGEHMRLLLAIGDGPPIRFTIWSSDRRGFVISSFLIVNSDGQPVWEFVRGDFEPCEMEEVHELSFVLTDEFRQVLQAPEPPRTDSRRLVLP